MFARLDASTTCHFPPSQTSRTTLMILMSTKCTQPAFSLCCTKEKKNTKKETSPGESPRLHWFVECNFDIKELHRHKGKGHVRVKQTAGRGMKKKKREKKLSTAWLSNRNDCGITTHKQTKKSLLVLLQGLAEQTKLQV